MSILAALATAPLRIVETFHFFRKILGAKVYRKTIGIGILVKHIAFKIKAFGITNSDVEAFLVEALAFKRNVKNTLLEIERSRRIGTEVAVDSVLLHGISITAQSDVLWVTVKLKAKIVHLCCLLIEEIKLKFINK